MNHEAWVFTYLILNKIDVGYWNVSWHHATFMIQTKMVLTNEASDDATQQLWERV